MLEETNDTEEIIGRVAALDSGKAALVCCVRVPGQGKGGRRLQEAFTGRFSHHHGFLLQTMLSRIDQASAGIAELEAKIQEAIAPFRSGGRPTG